MADQYRISLSRKASADLHDIFDYIAQKSPQNAAAMVQRILDEIESLKQMPGRYKRVATRRGVRSNVHSTVVWPFVIYYRAEQPLSPAISRPRPRQRLGGCSGNLGLCRQHRKSRPGAAEARTAGSGRWHRACEIQGRLQRGMGLRDELRRPVEGSQMEVHPVQPGQG